MVNKKVIYLLALIVGITLVFSGCVGGSDDSNNSGAGDIKDCSGEWDGCWVNAITTCTLAKYNHNEEGSHYTIIEGKEGDLCVFKQVSPDWVQVCKYPESIYSELDKEFAPQTAEYCETTMT